MTPETLETTTEAAGVETPSIPTRSIAYLFSQYPMLSMAFVIREVRHLREMGFHIDTVSINAPDRTREGLTAEEAIEAERTYHLKTHGLAGAFKAHLQTLLTNFAGYGRGLMLLLRLSGLDAKRFAFNLMYFTEALMV